MNDNDKQFATDVQWGVMDSCGYDRFEYQVHSGQCGGEIRETSLYSLPRNELEWTRNLCNKGREYWAKCGWIVQ